MGLRLLTTKSASSTIVRRLSVSSEVVMSTLSCEAIQLRNSMDTSESMPKPARLELPVEEMSLSVRPNILISFCVICLTTIALNTDVGLHLKYARIIADQMAQDRGSGNDGDLSRRNDLLLAP
ncbi:Compactin diketide synthase mlcB [Diaporthe eres]|nr:Compactin diketide synthase mlcB [Diaporthe eres]